MARGSAQSALPDGSRPVFLPAYSPELQPAERLWPSVNEPLANRTFATLEELGAVLSQRCNTLQAPRDHPESSFHWWPRPPNCKESP